MRFEHIPGRENPVDIMTKSLPWYMLKVFVEPLLFWKGDTKGTPKCSSNPEGSDTGPSHEQPFTLVSRGKNQTECDENENPPVVREGETLGETVLNALWNNKCSTLADDFGQEIIS